MTRERIWTSGGEEEEGEGEESKKRRKKADHWSHLKFPHRTQEALVHTCIVCLWAEAISSFPSPLFLLHYLKKDEEKRMIGRFLKSQVSTNSSCELCWASKMQIRASCYLMTERCDSITPLLPGKQRKQELKTRDEEEEGEGFFEISSHRQVTAVRTSLRGPKQRKRVSERTQHTSSSCSSFCPLFFTSDDPWSLRLVLFFLPSLTQWWQRFQQRILSLLYCKQKEGDGHTFPVSLHQPFFTIHSACYYFLSVQ